ncbi:MAG TPA: diguanylate cyclase [Novosphingobium sp.]|nr:diguanylate cyclase [Novosphingobium sp.]
MAAGLWSFAGTGTAMAAGRFPAGSACLASTNTGESFAELERRPGRWNCRQGEWSIDATRSYLRIDLHGHRGPAQLLTTNLSRFDALRLIAIGEGGAMAVRNVTPDAVRPGTSDWVMSVPLPVFTGPGSTETPLAALVLQVDNPRNLAILTDAKVVPDRPPDNASIRLEILLAGLCGILVVPLFFNFAFYRVLRERFLLWHAGAVLCMLLHTLATTGLINRFASLSILQLSMLSATSWGGGIIAAALFMSGLIEPGTLSRGNRLMLRGVALWVPLWTAWYLFAEGLSRPLASPAYNVSYVPVMGLFVWTMTAAKLRGSRAVNFQIAAWTPIMLVGIVRIASSLGATDTPIDLLLEQHIALTLEVCITSLGVADRFLAIRRQRDSALAQTKVLAAQAERDPLTGLYNRSFIEERFPGLFADGFRTMAVIDLDHFKQVNDNNGHAAGDDVLRTVARALMPDENTLAVRMGGEEFALLLRGNETVSRAERRRQAIPARITKDVPGLDRMVTASMGLVEHATRQRIAPDFTALYAHCDRLLYEAKRAGRNRVLSEKQERFVRPGGSVAA